MFFATIIYCCKKSPFVIKYYGMKIREILNVKSKILDLEVDEKNFKIICFIGIITILLFCLALYLEMGSLGKYKVQNNMYIDKNKEVEFTIDEVNTSRKYIEISGWAYKRGQNIGYFNNRFIIQNQKTKEYKALHTEMTYVGELFSVDEKYDCRRAGMYAKSIAISLKKGLYKIFIEYRNDDENILVDTGETFEY